MCDVVSCVVSN